MSILTYDEPVPLVNSSAIENVMVDLETMGTGVDSAIVAIGAVEFCSTTSVLGRTFYHTISLESSVQDGGIIDAATVLWWLNQENPARQEISRNGEPIRQILHAFTAWLQPCGSNVKIWGNGATFDNVVLAQAYRRAKLKLPWTYANDRCYRTLKALYPNVAKTRMGTHHNALDDAATQAQHAISILRAIREQK